MRDGTEFGRGEREGAAMWGDTEGRLCCVATAGWGGRGVHVRQYRYRVWEG